jgi:CubicO group peptidase (beta-lactamase class C family)
MRYSIGSISKQFTTAAILLLQQEGKLSIDDPVGKYIPGLTEGDKVTIRQILSHTSGYQDYWPEDYVMTPMLAPESAQQILDTWAKKPSTSSPEPSGSTPTPTTSSPAASSSRSPARPSWTSSPAASSAPSA